MATDVVVDAFQRHGAEAGHAADAFQRLVEMYLYVIAILRRVKAGGVVLLCQSSDALPGLGV